jgi:TonB family protein
MSESVFQVQELVVALGWTLLDFLWQGALIGLAYACARSLVGARRPQLRLALGNLALLAFAVVPVLTFIRHVTEGLAASADAASPSAHVTVTPLAAVADASAAGAGSTPDVLLLALVAVWSLGVLVLAARGLWRWRLTRRVCSSAQPMAEHWAPRIARLHARLRVRVAVLVRESQQVTTPILVGWLKPTILLPVGLCARLPIEQVEVVIAHELAHVVRFDAWFNAAQMALETLLFYHPVVHWLGRCVRQDRELCCDAAVAAAGLDRLVYARALLALAEDQRMRATSGLALAATGGTLLTRVEVLLQVESGESARVAGWAPAALLGLAAAVLALPAGSGWLNDSKSLLPLAPTQPSLQRLAPIVDLVLRDLRLPLSAPALTLHAATPARTAEGPVRLPEAVLPAPLAADMAPTAWAELNIPTELSTVVPALALATLAPPAAIADDAPLAAVAEQPLRPLLRESPTYPPAALRRGIEGSVELSFQVDASGRPVDIRIESSSLSMFAAAAREAVAGWRYAANTTAAARQHQHFEFNLDNRGQGEGRPGCPQVTGTRICLPEF